MKYLECLPQEVAQYVATLSDVREIRIRNGRAVRLNLGGKWYYLNKESLSLQYPQNAAMGDVCDNVIRIACNNSVYAHERMLSKGFFTLEDGCRIGVGGSVAGEKENIFQKYTSLCFRIPHDVNCVSEFAYRQCRGQNVIVIGPPNSGKTTFLKSLSAMLSNDYNVLIADERGELSASGDVVNSNCDVIKWTSKSYVLSVGARALSPDVIVCDELAEEDAPFVKSCVNCGIKLVCSAHGSSTEDFSKRFHLLDCFQTAVILDKSNRYRIENVSAIS